MAAEYATLFGNSDEDETEQLTEGVALHCSWQEKDCLPLQCCPPKAREPVPRTKPRQQYVSKTRKIGDAATHRPGRHSRLTKKHLHERLSQHDEQCHGQYNGHCKMSSIRVQTILDVWKTQLSCTEPELSGRILVHLKEQCSTKGPTRRTNYQWDGLAIL